MKQIRIILSDLHLGTGIPKGKPNPLEDFHHGEKLVELLQFYDENSGAQQEIELILNGDIFDLLKIKIGGIWPTEISNDIAKEKLRQCLNGHPEVVHALQKFLSKPKRRITYLPGNHDLDMLMEGPQELFLKYIAPGDLSKKVNFITHSDSYYLPEGIQIRHGHQFEVIHRVDYNNLTYKRRDDTEILKLPWGSLWILEVMNPAKEQRHHIDRIQPLSRFLLGALLFDTWFALQFISRTVLYFLKRRIFTFRAWKDRIKNLPHAVRRDVFALGGYDQTAIRALNKMRGTHTLIVGHSHGPRYMQLPNNKLLVNTGTWMNMINLDIQYLGQNSGLTYALIEYDDNGKPDTKLLRWLGNQTPFENIPYAD